MNSEHLKRFLTSVTVKHFLKSTKVFQEGEDSNGIMYFVFSGKLIVTKKSGTGEELILRQIGAGEFFGELALIQPSPRAATVVAVADDTKVGILTKDIFLALGNESPEFLSVLLHSVINRLTEVEDKVISGKNKLHYLINSRVVKPALPIEENPGEQPNEHNGDELPIPIDPSSTEEPSPPVATIETPKEEPPGQEEHAKKIIKS